MNNVLNNDSSGKKSSTSGNKNDNPLNQKKNEQKKKAEEDSGSRDRENDKKRGGYTGGRTQEELDDLARDPSHANRIEAQGIKEREIGLDLEESGVLGKIIRDPQGNGGAEFIDMTTGIKWDIKSFESYPNGHTNPKKGAFTVKNAMKKIYNEFEKGHNVIIDVRNLTPEHTRELRDAIEQAGVSERIIWYP